MTIQFEKGRRLACIAEGSVMGRLSSEDFQLDSLDSTELRRFFGGGEANAGINLGYLLDSMVGLVTAIPKNDLGNWIADRLRADRVVDDFIQRPAYGKLGHEARVGMNYVRPWRWRPRTQEHLGSL